jgi:hypothetical protein
MKKAGRRPPFFREIFASERYSLQRDTCFREIIAFRERF